LEAELMNSKGIFLTVIIVFFLISLIYFSSSINSSINSFSFNYAEISRINSVNSKFNSIYSGIILLDSSGALKELKERILPFTYSLDLNSFFFSSQIPLLESNQKMYFDYINTFKVLFSDNNHLNAFDGLETDINVIQNQDWGGTDNSMNFLLKSHCAKNSFNDLNNYNFSFTECNSNEFNFNYLNSIDLNLTTKTEFIEDFNSVYCNFNGIETCFQNDFNELNSFPFIKIIFNSENCNNCELNPITIISTHFNPLENNYIIFSCVGIECESEPIRIDLFNELIISRDGSKRIDFDLKYDFNSTVSQFELNDVSFKVSNKDSLTEKEFLK
jgi:hypothetical protein